MQASALRAKTRSVQRLVRQFWGRRRDFGQVEFWKKSGRIGANLAQNVVWPERVLSAELREFEARPWNLHIETTNACNADCVFCAYQYMERKKQVMKMDVFEAALAQYVAIGGGDLLLEVVVGDPTTDPTFLEKVRRARAEPEIARIETITNGIAIHRIGAENLIASGISKISISTAGFERSSYEQLYRSKDYDKMRSNVLALLRANEAAGSPVEIVIGFRTNRPLETVLADRDFQELRQYKPGIDFVFAFSDWVGRIDFDELPQGFLRREPPPQTETCVWLYDGPIVFANGDLGLCGCQDVEASSELVVGNIMQTPLHELWRSARVRQLRERFMTRDKPDVCRVCTSYRNLDALRSVTGVRRARWTRQRLRTSRCHGAVYAEPKRRLPLA